MSHNSSMKAEIFEGRACTKCGEWKPASDFYIRKSGEKPAQCKKCETDATKRRRVENPEKYRKIEKNTYEKGWTNQRLMARKKDAFSKYGLTFEDFLGLLKSQDGKCSVCGSSIYVIPSERGKQDGAVIDHDHSTGKIRGLLCNRCNRGIGFLGDGIEGLENALKYLKRNIS